MNQAQSVAATPWQNYSGEFVSPVNQQQYTGISNINQYAQYALPTLGIAQNMAWNAAQPITQADIQQYQNPWTQDVINATAAQFSNQNAQQLQNVRGNAIAQGALGGDREAVAEAELTNQENLAQAPVIAGLESQGYTQGVNTALTEKQALASGAYSLGNLGVAAQSAGLTGAGAQIQAGGLEQQTQQQQDTALYNQWLASRAYPFQTTQWLAGLDTGVGSQMGGTSTTTAPSPSPWSQIAGLGLGALGIVGGTGGFGSNGWVGQLGTQVGNWWNGQQTARGGRVVPHYDSGGGVSPLPYASGGPWEPYAGGRGWVPVANMTHGQGLPRPPQPPQQGNPMQLGEQVAGLTKYFNGGQGVAPPMRITPQSVPQSPVGTMAAPGSSPGSWSPYPDSGSAAQIYRHGGVVRGYAEGGAPSDFSDVSDDDLAAMTNYHPSDAGFRGVSKTFTPGLYNYFTASRPPPSITPNAAGKIPSNDPYAIPALREATSIAGMAIPAGRAEALAEGVAPYIARGAQAATPVLRNMMENVGAMGGSAGISQAYAGERPSLTSDDTTRLNQLEHDIAGLTKQKQIAIGQVGRSRIAATAQGYDQQIAAKQAEIDRVRSSISERQGAFDKAGLPLSIRDPQATSTLRYGGLGLGAMTGLVGGIKRMPALHSAAYGAIEGGLGAAAPTLIDLPMPQETEAGKQARANIHSPEWYSDVVGPDTVAGALAGLGFHGTGNVIGGRRAGVAGPATLPAVTSTPTAGGRTWPTDPRQIKMIKDSAGRWREQGTGQFIPKHLQPPSGKVVPMHAAEANGGAVRGYWGGGSPFADVPADELYGGLAPQGVADPSVTASVAVPAQTDENPVDRSYLVQRGDLSWTKPTPAAQGTFRVPGRPTAAEADAWAAAHPATFAPGMQTVGPGGVTSGPAPYGYGPEDRPGATAAQWATYESTGRPIPHDALPVSYNSNSAMPSYRSNGVAGRYGDLVPLSPAPGTTGTTPTGGVAPQSGIDWSSNSKLWPALMAAGFGMMASRSPYPLQAIGEGALTGMGAYTKASELESQRAMKQSEIDMQGQRLWQANENERKKLALEAAKFEWSTLQPATIQTPMGPRSVQKLPDGTYRDLQSGQLYGGQGQPTDTQQPSVQPAFTPVQYGDPRNKLHAVETHPEVLDEITKTNPGTAGQGMAAKVKAVSEGRESISTIPMRDRSAFENYLHAYDPNWTQQVYLQRQRLMNDLSTNGNAGKMILAVNQLWPHLDKASKQAEALDNTNYPAVNIVKNWFATATGDPRIGQFNNVREVAAMDAARLLRGTGAMAEKDIEFWRKNLSESGSPRQLQNNLADLADDLMRARVGSIEQSYRFIMGKEPPDFISLDAKGALTNVVKMREITNARDRLDKGDSRESVEAGLRDAGIDPSKLGPQYAPRGPVKGRTLVTPAPAAAQPAPTEPTPALPPGAPPGARRAKDGKIYFPDTDPDRAGKYREWIP